MQKIRQGVWETNSSSMHAICVHKQQELPLPDYIYFGLEDIAEFDGEIMNIQQRANYINTIMYVCLDKTGYINKQKEIKDILGKYGIKIEWAKVHWNPSGLPDYDLYSVKDSCMTVVLDKILKDELLLVEFLFGEKSAIIAGYEEVYDEYLKKMKEKYPEGKEYEYLYEY